MTEFFDSAEVESAEKRELALFAKLPSFLHQSINNLPALSAHLGSINPEEINSREALAGLPVLRKSKLIDEQRRDPPFGGFVDSGELNGTRLFMSPGPVWEPQGLGSDPWQCARALYAAGIRAGDKVHNAFSYHITPGGFILDEGARALGCQVFPAGSGNTDQQVEAATAYKPDVYVGTPDFLKILLDRASEHSLNLDSINRALVSGGALFPAMREEYRERGVTVLQCYATADLGVIAYETQSANLVGPGMVVNENIIVEIVRPGSGEVVEDGEVGELVITTFNSVYPLIRFATGDLSAILPGESTCGRTGQRIKGWMGRADQRTKVRGMFVDPAQIAQIRKTHPDISRARLVVGRADSKDTLTLQVEGKNLDVDSIAVSMQSVLGLKGVVERMDEPLPNDGVVVADERDYT